MSNKIITIQDIPIRTKQSKNSYDKIIEVLLIHLPVAETQNH